APGKLLKEPYSSLMSYLMNGIFDDLSKVRVIYRWVTSLKLERIFLPKVEPPATTPLYQIWRIKNRKGNYAQLVSILCSEGNDDWLEIDDGGEDETEKKADSKFSTKEYVYVCDENYFLTDPRQLITTHLPFTQEWQLLSEPLSLERFERMAFLKDRFFNLGMSVITHADCVISSHSGEVEICFGMPPDDARFFKFYYLLFRQETKENSGFAPKYDRYVFMHRPKKDELSIRIRSPVTGTFRLELVGRDTRIKDPMYDYDWVVLYKIRFFKAKEKCLPFPSMPELGWGPGPYSMQLGLSPLSHCSGEVKANTLGEAEISFEVCDYNRLGNPMFYGTLCKSGSNDEKIKDRVVHRVENGRVIFNVKLPKRGEYSLAIDGTSGKKPTPRNFANYMLVSDQRLGQTSYPRGFDEGIGRKLACSRFDIEPLSHSSGLIHVQQEEFEISFKVSPDSELSLSLIGSDVMVSDSRRLVSESRTEDTIRYKIRLPKEGTYGLKVIGKTIETTQFENVYDYIVEYRNPHSILAGSRQATVGGENALNPLGSNKPHDLLSPAATIRKRIDVAIEAEDEYELAATLDELMLSGVTGHRGQTEIARLKHELQIIYLKKDLLGAIHERSLPELVRSVTLVKERGHEHKMVTELREATKMMERLQQIQNLLHDVQVMSQKTITEIRGYSCPPPAVHMVMMATLLLLGHFEEETEAKGIIDEIIKRHSEEVAHTRPRTSKSRRGRRNTDFTSGAQ
ncbi:kyphoscoliosis peptidase, partial [Plakobranchus ocellatus]